MRPFVGLVLGCLLVVQGCMLFENFDRIQPDRTTCRSGTQIECACKGGHTGSQSCRADGTYGPCRCTDTSSRSDGHGTRDGGDGDQPVDVDQLTACEAGSEPADELLMFDATKIRGAPEPLPGLQKLDFWSANAFWPSDADRTSPHRQKIQETAAEMKIDRPNVINIQRWGWESGTISTFIDIATWIREKNKNLVIGFFDMPPVRDFSDNRRALLEAISANDTEELGTWAHDWNERAHRLAERVDAIFPSVFPVTDDLETWKQYASAKICEAKQYDLPVYAFVWMQYDAAVFGQSQEFIPADDWEAMLRHVRGLGVDGIVVYTNSRDSDGNRLTWSTDGEDSHPQKETEWFAVLDRLQKEWSPK